MPLSFCVLGSGSSGNCTLLRLGTPGGDRHVLIDAGLSPRETKKRLRPSGVALDEITDVLLTHPDHDHIHPGWIKAGPRLGITWHVHRRHLRHARIARLPLEDIAPVSDGFELFPDAIVEPVALPHDSLGTTGYVIENGGVRLGFATDLGRVPESFVDRYVNLSALAIESNYDRCMQMESDRPQALKRRIMGGLGHLSNEQTLAAVLGAADRGDLRHIALLHLSRHCNDPRIVKRLYAGRAPHLLDRLTITNQDEPTPMLRVSGNGRPNSIGTRCGEQLSFRCVGTGPSGLC